MGVHRSVAAARQQQAAQTAQLQETFTADLAKLQTECQTRSQQVEERAARERQEAAEKEREAEAARRSLEMDEMPPEERAARLARAQESLVRDRTRFHVALVGPSGASKSSLINGILEKEVADVGVTETTNLSTPYDVPGTNLTLWDLPGFGTLDHPSKTYFTDKHLYAFDACIFLYTSRLPAEFSSLCAKWRLNGVSHAVVRGKADVDLDSLSRKLSRQAAVAQLRTAIQRELAGVAIQTFLVSARDMEKGTACLDEQAFVEFLKLAATTARPSGARSG